jgi:DNA-binding NarL/FixJ family response regulator
MRLRRPGCEHGAVGRTLLIVDDHAGFREFARALFEAEGFVVVGEAENGESALLAAGRLNPDVVLLDVALPDLDGFTVCERLARDGDRPAIVMTSSRDIASHRGALERSRARGFIAKADLSGLALTDLSK